jgi:acyl-CoA reductase-like NAD-dependent aldehyde dehydrogenase
LPPAWSGNATPTSASHSFNAIGRDVFAIWHCRNVVVQPILDTGRKESSHSILFTMSSSVQRVLDAAVEGQAQSPRHIQKQLSKLHATLIKDGTAIRSAILSESRHSVAEVEIQYALALEAVATSFAESDFDKALHAEFRLSRSENAASNIVPYAVAYIVPSTYNVLYSCVSAVVAAISAGSCVILEVSPVRGISQPKLMCNSCPRHFRERQS